MSARSSTARHPVRRRLGHAVGLLLGTGVLLAAEGQAQQGGTAPAARRCRAGTAVVSQITVAGNRVIPTVEILAALSTVPSPRPRRLGIFSGDPIACVDTTELTRDALRAAVLFRERGYLQATATIERRGTTQLTAVVNIREGRLFTVGAIDLPGVPPGTYAEPLIRMFEQPLNRLAVAVAIDSTQQRLLDAGYARATVPRREIVVDTVNGTGRIIASFSPGLLQRIGEVRLTFSGEPKHRVLRESYVRELLNLRPGAPLRARDIIRAQRDLYQLDAYRLVLIDTVPTAAPNDSVLDLAVRLAETRAHQVRSGIGWATQECGRAQLRYVDRALTGRPLRAEVNARLGLLGAGDPFGQARGLCAPVVQRDTVFSTQLNFYLGATLQTPRTSRTRLAPAVTVFRERRSEINAFIRNTSLGALIEAALPDRRWPVTFGYQIESGSTLSEPAVQCARFGICELTDVVFSILGNSVQVASTSILADRTDRPLDPTHGARVRLDLRAGSTFDIGGEASGALDIPAVPFSKMTGEVAWFAALSRRLTLATRVQLSGVAVGRQSDLFGARFLPQQERLFTGGQSSVRGYLQNQLGPLVYLVDSVKTTTVDETQVATVADGARVTRVAPRGGTGLGVANVELRRRFSILSTPLQWVAFIDAGTLWERSVDRLRWSDVRVTPGIGVRIETPLGPFRLDAGYNPYTARAGRAYFVEPTAVVGGNARRVLCASPGNRIDISTSTELADPAACPESYSPPTGRGRLSRFAFHFSLGQAF
jgi:outer membrane protein insertion porin family/translocation and assembly module TamA